MADRIADRLIALRAAALAFDRDGSNDADLRSAVTVAFDNALSAGATARQAAEQVTR